MDRCCFCTMFAKNKSGRVACSRSALSKFPLSHIREVALDRRRRRHHRTDEMCAAATTLPSFEVPVTRRRATLARLQCVGIHSQTHRAPGFTPFESCFVKDAIESFSLGCLLHIL